MGTLSLTELQDASPAGLLGLLGDHSLCWEGFRGLQSPWGRGNPGWMINNNRRWTDENASPEPQEPLRGCVSLHDTNCDMVNANFCAPGSPTVRPRQRQCIWTTTPRPNKRHSETRWFCADPGKEDVTWSEDFNCDNW